MPRSIRTLTALFVVLAIMTAAVAWQTGPPPGEEPVRHPVATYWKGNLHTHSLWSDGDDFPEMIAEWYKSHGYQFLAISDHNRLQEGERWIDAGTAAKAGGAVLQRYRNRFGDAWVDRRDRDGKPQVRLKPLAEYRSLFDEPQRFQMIPAEEITHKYAKNPVHLGAINLRDVIRPTDGASVEETARVNLRAIAEQQKKTGTRMLAIVNHPNFGWGVRAEDLILADEVRYLEIYNGHPGVRNYGDAVHASCERVWDILLALRLGKHHLPVVHGVATDDAHGYHAFGVGKMNPGRGWIMVKSTHLSAEGIIKAMEAGDFYSTTGVMLNAVDFDSKELRISIQGEKGVRYTTQWIATPKDARLESHPMLDENGQELPVTRVYSDDVGKVVAETVGTDVKYRLTGKEWYVRARIISSKPHPNPFQQGDVEMAWTQPFTP